MSREISRRTFIKGAAAAGVVLVAGSYFTWNGRNIPEKVQRGDVTYDVLIIGSGGAGMRAALAAAENKELKVAVLTKLVPTRSASTMAQGGMNGVTGVTDPNDSFESHAFDTIKGGDYLCDQDAVEYFVERAGKNIYEMDYMGYPYNRQADGHFHQRKMGGHAHARAAYFEDRAGHAMVHTLFEQCLAHDIDFISECQMLEISMAGEKKDKLAGVIAMEPEVLILDEPTNHLDIASREWIEEAVEAFDGTLLFVSHDRYFINRFATRVWELEEQRITDYPMGFARYRKIKAEQPAKKSEPEKTVKEKSLTEKPPRGNKNQQAAHRQLTICEREIAQQEEALAALDARLEEAASDYEKYSALYTEKEAQEQKLTELMERWEALAAEAGE